jgi:uncharacterized protein YdaU (DUF1376 family)
MKWWPRYPGDFVRDTGHLSLAEKGAYGALLDHYYSTEKPLPIDLPALCRIAGAQEELEVAAVRRVVAEFFPVNGDGARHNKRADQEIAKSKSKAKSSAAGGQKRASGMTPEERREAARAAAESRWKGGNA